MGGVGKPRPPVYGKLRLCAAFGCGKKKGAQPYPAVRKREAHGQSRSCADNTSCFGFGNGESPGAAHCVPDLSRPGGHHSDLLAGTLTPFRRQPQDWRAVLLFSSLLLSDMSRQIARGNLPCGGFFHRFHGKNPSFLLDYVPLGAAQKGKVPAFFKNFFTPCDGGSGGDAWPSHPPCGTAGAS